MTRALLVIDVQNEYFTGALPITHPVGHLDSITRVMDVAKEHAVPTVVVRHHMADEAAPLFRHGSHEWQLHEEVENRQHHKLIDKQLPGSFTNTDLEAWLKENGIDTVTISGYMTHMCCDTTARQAAHRGLKVEFLSDATGTLPLDNEAGSVTAEELQRAILCSQQMLISEVLPSEQWFERL
ncbi:MAG: cysteine hydrolase family protein [Planctomycetaceae bacterium]